VFDIQSKGSQTHEVAILDPHRRQIFLLDRFREVKLQLDEIHLIKMADSLRKQTATNKAAGFLINDRFEEHVDYDTGTATLTSPIIKYTVRGRRPSDVRMLPQYNQFADYFTRMKFSDPQAFPPFPRLRLNETLSKLGWIPTDWDSASRRSNRQKKLGRIRVRTGRDLNGRIIHFSQAPAPRSSIANQTRLRRSHPH